MTARQAARNRPPWNHNPSIRAESHIRESNAVIGIGAFDAVGAGSSMADCRATVEAAAKSFYDAVQP